MTVFRLLHNHASSSNEETGDNDTVAFLHVYSRQNSYIFKYYELSVPLCLIRSFSRASLPLARSSAWSARARTDELSDFTKYIQTPGIKNDKRSPLTVQEDQNVLDRNWTQPERLVRRVVVTGERASGGGGAHESWQTFSARSLWTGDVMIYKTWPHIFSNRLHWLNVITLNRVFKGLFKEKAKNVWFVVIFVVDLHVTLTCGPSYGSIFVLIFYWKLNLRVQYKKNHNIEKIIFKVVQMRFLAMHITYQKINVYW